MTGHMISSTELCSTYPGRIEDILKMGARVGVCIVINIKRLTMDHNWRLARYKRLFVYINKIKLAVDEVRLVAPILPFRPHFC